MITNGVVRVYAVEARWSRDGAPMRRYTLVPKGWSTMIRIYTPQPPLSHFVACFWLQEGPPQPVKERALPTGTTEVVINLRDDCLQLFNRRNPVAPLRFPGSIVCGPHSEYFIIDSADSECILGVHFKPGGAFPFLGPPPAELHNTHIPLKALWGAEADLLREELLRLSDVEERFQWLERFLLERAVRPLAIDPRLTRSLTLLRSGTHEHKVAGVADALGLSHRRFIEIFRTAVGLTPKQFMRIQRFQQAIRRLDRGANSWAEIAYACGYYDQSHLIHEFRTLGGITPSAYVRDRTDRHNHVLVAE